MKSAPKTFIATGFVLGILVLGTSPVHAQVATQDQLSGSDASLSSAQVTSMASSLQPIIAQIQSSLTADQDAGIDTSYIEATLSDISDTITDATATTDTQTASDDLQKVLSDLTAILQIEVS